MELVERAPCFTPLSLSARVVGDVGRVEEDGDVRHRRRGSSGTRSRLLTTQTFLLTSVTSRWAEERAALPPPLPFLSFPS